MPLAPDTTVAHYRILSRLGEGGMGEVYLARDTRLNRSVAVKILPAALAQNPEHMRRFTQEARAASALSHPNVAYILEIGVQPVAGGGELPFLAMEYVEGHPLSARMRGRPLPIAEVVAIGRQVADALDAAAAKGITHRDIKPSNIMIMPRGHVKVLDFGLAKIAEEEEARQDGVTQVITSSGLLLGTVPYMSPEQALGRELDGRSDIFSLGVVLYEMAAGRLPFSGATPAETIAHTIHDPPEAVARFNYAVPDELDRIIRKCLEKDRERRYQSARELEVDLVNMGRDRAGVPAPPQRSLIRAVIVDDEELARGFLREMLRSERDVQIVAECSNGFEAVKAASELKPDLLFLDVQMPKLNGLEVLELIGSETAVIFVTAYDNYAMKAFDSHAVDYLLKPFSAERFQAALQRARLRLGASPAQPSPAAELAAAARPPGQYARRIVVKDGARVHVIPVDKLDYAEAQDDYVSLASEQKHYLKQQTISSLESTLDPERFIRIHRSYIVNLDRVVRIEPYSKDSRIAVLSDGKQLPVSRAGYARLKALLGEGE